MKRLALFGSSCAAGIIFTFCSTVMVSHVESVPMLDVFRSSVMGFAARGLFFFVFVPLLMRILDRRERFRNIMAGVCFGLGCISVMLCVAITFAAGPHNPSWDGVRSILGIISIVTVPFGFILGAISGVMSTLNR